MWSGKVLAPSASITGVQLKLSKLKPNCCNTLPSKLQALAMKTLEEADVGILCYISQLPGFRGVLKQRYSDFIVNEVDSDGNVVHLTCLDPPPENVEENERKVPDKSDNSYTSEIELFRSLAGDSDTESLKAFLTRIASGGENDVSPIVLSPDSDKSHRTAIHNFVKEKFKFLVTDTVDGPETTSKCIRLRLNSGGQNKGRNSKKRKDRGDKPFDSRNSDDWPEHIGKFLRFHLFKENKDTQEALGLIAKMLGIQQKSFGFAGTKDKRSVSTQRVTIFKLHAKRLAALNERLFGIKVGNFSHVKEGLVLGQLLGNRFIITLRGVLADSEATVKAAADALGRHGFVNYFGLQRFGSGSVPTHAIGAALLRGEWKTAVNMILDPREGERDAVRKIREYYKDSGDIEATLRELPRYLVAERAILQCLKKCPGNYLQALKAIPRTLRMMYVHSYQSYLWNHAASMRVQKHGSDKVVVGDLVYWKKGSTEITTDGINIEAEEDGDDDAYNTSLLDDSGTALSEERDKLVKAVNSEDLLTGDYTVDDVILPLPGSKVLYPMNDITEIYHDLAKKDGISLTESVHNVKEFSITSMSGGYRRVFQKPIDFEWELLTYTDGNMPLVETDLDIISKSRPVNVIREGGSTNGSKVNDLTFNCKQQPENFDDEIKPSVCNYEAEDEQEVQVPLVDSLRGSDAPEAQKALKLGFTLPASCYATMAIRELLKTSTSVAFHKALNL